MVCRTEPLIDTIFRLYTIISRLESLEPSDEVNQVFTELVTACIPPNPIDVTKQCMEVQEMRSKLIKLCGEAEGHLESHYSAILGSYENPLAHLDEFPYYNNYETLSDLEFTLLTPHITHVPRQIAFVGSGPLPLSSICLASSHLRETTFHNYDIDPSANSLASALIESNPNLSERMVFHTANILDVQDELRAYDVVFLAALVGMDEEEKARVIGHLANNMAPGALLVLRSAHGARAFLYPVVNPFDLSGFKMLSVFHPINEVINSVVIARSDPSNTELTTCNCLDNQISSSTSHSNQVEEIVD